MIVLTCSGTGGHIYPAIATAQRSDGDVHFLIEKNSIAQEILPEYDCHYTELPMNKRFKLSYIPAFLKAYRFFRKHRVDRCISFGGYATVPVLLAAKLKKVPIVICEQNSVPGKANRLLQSIAEKICISFESSRSFFKHPNVVFTGNPLRKEYPQDKIAEQAISHSKEDTKHCVIMGGSQGAEFINRFIKNYKEHISDGHLSIIHILGKNNYEKYVDDPSQELNVTDIKKCRWIQVPYIENMHILYDWADKVISRAGATTIAELKYYKKDALLIPYPYATDNHQEENAKDYLKTGLGEMLLQKTMNVGQVKRFLGKGVFSTKTPGEDANFDAILD